MVSKAESDMTERRRYRVHGTVQGVGFRAHVWRQVQRLEIAGWVRNRYDGTVEVLADGGAEAHQQLTAILEKGPSLAVVDRVEIAPEAREHEDLVGFAVVPDA
jgi:acylphosphatase